MSRVKNNIGLAMSLAMATQNGAHPRPLNKQKSKLTKDPNDPYQQAKIKKAEEKRKRKALKRLIDTQKMQK